MGILRNGGVQRETGTLSEKGGQIEMWIGAWRDKEGRKRVQGGHRLTFFLLEFSDSTILETFPWNRLILNSDPTVAAARRHKHLLCPLTSAPEAISSITLPSQVAKGILLLPYTLVS